MMTKWRDQFMMQAGKHGIPTYHARLFLRYARTLQRLSEAQCNGDYPADNGERNTKECAKCGGFWAPSFIRRDGVCGECKTEERAKKQAQALGFAADTAGDPRGCVLTLKTADGTEIGVPS